MPLPMATGGNASGCFKRRVAEKRVIELSHMLEADVLLPTLTSDL